MWMFLLQSSTVSGCLAMMTDDDFAGRTFGDDDYSVGGQRGKESFWKDLATDAVAAK